MTKYIYTLLSLAFLLLSADFALAGNPDRQGEAGAAQLLMNPWARSSGLSAMTTASIYGVEAMRLNPAGIGRINKSEFVFGHTRYFEGTGISINSFGFASKVGKNGALGVSIMAVDVGDLPLTTDAQPGGTGATFSPGINNLGLGYSHVFENRISVGFVARVVSEGTADVRAVAAGFDAGVQYVTGPQDNFKFGISLRNIGTRLTFRGQGLSVTTTNPGDQGDYTTTYFQRSQAVELPSMLNIGTSYDFVIDPKNRVTVLGNFTANSFSQDQIGGGIEYTFNNIVAIRGGYKYEFGSDDPTVASVYTGVSGGISLEVPTKKESDNKIGIDYAYRTTRLWGGTHNISIRLNL